MLKWERADADGVLAATAPAGFDRFALALFSPRHLLDGTDADGVSLSVDNIRTHLDRFDADYDRIVGAFGTP